MKPYSQNSNWQIFITWGKDSHLFYFLRCSILQDHEKIERTLLISERNLTPFTLHTEASACPLGCERRVPIGKHFVFLVVVAKLITEGGKGQGRGDGNLAYRGRGGSRGG